MTILTWLSLVHYVVQSPDFSACRSGNWVRYWRCLPSMYSKHRRYQILPKPRLSYVSCFFFLCRASATFKELSDLDCRYLWCCSWHGRTILFLLRSGSSKYGLLAGLLCSGMNEDLISPAWVEPPSKEIREDEKCWVGVRLR